MTASERPEPEDLTPEDLELVPNPVADHRNQPVPRWQAEMLADLVPAYRLVRRAAAAVISGNWPAIDAALAEAHATDTVEACLRVALMELGVVAVDGAEGDRELGAAYFETLLLKQQQIDGDD